MAILALVAGIAIIETITKPLLGIVTEALSFVTDIVTGLIITALIAIAIPNAYQGSKALEDVIPADVDAGIKATFTVVEFATAMSVYLATKTRTLKYLSMIAPVGMAVAIMSLLLLGVKATVLKDDGDQKKLGVRVIFDTLAIMLAVFALAKLKMPGPIKRWYRILSKVDVAFGLISVTAGFTELVVDVSKLTSP